VHPNANECSSIIGLDILTIRLHHETSLLKVEHSMMLNSEIVAGNFSSPSIHRVFKASVRMIIGCLNPSMTKYIFGWCSTRRWQDEPLEGCWCIA
jgi:hypothetical protein